MVVLLFYTPLRSLMDSATDPQLPDPWTAREGTFVVVRKDQLLTDPKYQRRLDRVRAEDRFRQVRSRYKDESNEDWLVRNLRGAGSRRD